MKEKYPIETLLALRERRYGKPGEFAEPVGTAVTFGWPGGGEENERHYARKE